MTAARERGSCGGRLYRCCAIAVLHSVPARLPTAFMSPSPHSVILLPCYLPTYRTHPVDWNNPAHPLARKEPRRGERAVLRAVVATPQVRAVVATPQVNAHSLLC